jgi:hypothetical protein
MKINLCKMLKTIPLRVAGIASTLAILCACNDDKNLNPNQQNNEQNDTNFQITMGGLTRSPETDVLDNMLFYCFNQGGSPNPAAAGSWSSTFNHRLLGFNRTSETQMKTNQARPGNWDLVMVSVPQSATLTSPVVNKEASKSLMYTYNPEVVNTETGERTKAPEIWHRMLRLPEIRANVDNRVEDDVAVARNMARVRIKLARGVDLKADGVHTVTLLDVPSKISWAGTLLKENPSGVYETSTTEYDVVPDEKAPAGRLTRFETNADGTLSSKNDSLLFIVPAHREKDFWAHPNAQTDIIEKKMRVAVKFEKNGGGFFEKTAEIPVVLKSNADMEVLIRMKDVNIELETDVTDWSDETVAGDMDEPWLTISEPTITVYDGAASRLYFWSNQPKVYVSAVTNTSALYTIIGEGASNLHYTYDENTHSGVGYVDLANAQLLISTYSTEVNITLVAADSTGKILVKREKILVKRLTSAQARKMIATEYVGTFHRALEVGERIVAWRLNAATDWVASIDDPDGSGKDVLIDRLPSPAFAESGDKQLYEAAPLDAENGVLTDHTLKSVSGGKYAVYFRVGWKTTNPNGADGAPRFASITVQLKTATGTETKKIYLRQGEGASAVYTTGRESPACFSPYNLTTKDGIGVITDENPITFTQYPTQAGSYFQWMNETNKNYAYGTGTTRTGPWNNATPFVEYYWRETMLGSTSTYLDASYESCPPGYRRMADGSTAGEPSADMRKSELRQSLWGTPDAASGGATANSRLGFYADGFFDRRAIVYSPNAVSHSTVRTVSGTTADDKTIAYKGRLFFDGSENSSKASVFFPAAGQRTDVSGALNKAGQYGYYWTATSTVDVTNIPEPSATVGVGVSTQLRSFAMSIRCVAE